MNTTTTALQAIPSLETLTSLVGQAMSGDETSLAAVQTLFNQAPAIFQEVFSITKKVETAWNRPSLDRI